MRQFKVGAVGVHVNINVTVGSKSLRLPVKIIHKIWSPITFAASCSLLTLFSDGPAFSPAVGL